VKLHLSPALALPLDAVTEKLAFLGRTGSGKTYAASKLAEEMHAARAQFVVLDPVGKWWSLRLAADGTAPGIAIPVFGGLHGDVPLEPTSGKLVADVICDRGISLVIDVSQFESDADKARFATEFAARFFYRKKGAPSAVHLFLEEAQEFIPQNPQREEARMLHAFTRIWKLGRNFGIGGSLLTQRPQEVNKKVLNLTELLFCFQLSGPHERKAVDGWIAEKGIDEDISGELPKLARGHAHAWSPAWLDISKVIAIGTRWTFDASSTPKVGARADARELATIDLEKLRSDMAATIERAKAEDPKELRRRIAELEREARHTRAMPAPAKPDEAAVARRVERAVAAAERLRASARRKDLAELKQLLAAIGRASLSDAGARLAAALAYLETMRTEPEVPVTVAPEEITAPARQTVRTPARDMERTVATPPNGDGAVSRPQQRMLDSLAAFEELDIPELTWGQLAVYSTQSPKSSGFEKNVSILRSNALIETRPGKRFALTETGRQIASAADRPASLDALHEAWSRYVSGPQWRMLAALIRQYPRAIDYERLAEISSQSPTSSGYEKNISTLRSLGLIQKGPANSPVSATALLFPAGLT